METAVSVKNISKTYPKGKTEALSDISFEMPEGEMFGVIGPDGAGKTTLFRIITSLILPNSGSASVFGFDTNTNYKQIRHIIGYMPGRFSLYQDLSVQENLQFFATVFGTTIDANYHLIKDIYSQIEPFKHRQAGKLSGGMKQKLALSCALIHAPKLLVLDEPTTGVDAVSRKEFWEMLKRLKEQNISIIVSTPYMDEAVLCDRVALMQNGKLLQIDTPQNIMDSFPHLLYNVKSDNMAALIKDVEAYPNTQSVFIFGQHLHYIDKNENADIQQLRAYLTNKNHSSISIEKGKADIEDCFMALMTK